MMVPEAARRLRYAAIGVVLVAGACARGLNPTSTVDPQRPMEGSSGVVASPGPVAADLSASGRAWVDATLASLTLRQATAQLVIQWMPGSYASPSSPEFEEWAEWVEEQEIGGIYLSIGLPHSYAAKVNELQRRARIPLLVTSDFENGGPGMRINHSYALPSLLPQGGGTSFPPTMAFGAVGDESVVREYARITAVEARAVGVQLNFAPVLDVNSNPENPIINTRSFGEDPAAVARLGAAYVEGAHEGGLLATGKHFPGHGDTQTDSHVDLPIVPADWERLNSVELVPFREGILSGLDAVMTAHVMVEGVQGLEGPPATLDPRFMTELLRDEMGFEGLLFTDALVMGAITQRYGAAEVAVQALQAGTDVLLMPTDVAGAIDAVVSAVEQGVLSEERVRASTRRVLEAKARVGLHEERFVDLDRVDDVVGSGPHLAFADTVAARSITLVRDAAGAVPLDPSGQGRVLSLTYSRADQLVAGTAFDPILRERVGEITSVRVGPETAAATYDSLRAYAADVAVVLINAYVPPRAGAGEVAVPDHLRDFVEGMARDRPTVVISFGNPYLLTSFPSATAYLIAWGEHEVSQRAAARALLGDAAITGRLPVSIPPYHGLGEGLQRSVRAERASARFGPQTGFAGVPVTVSPMEVTPLEVGLPATAFGRVDSLLAAAVVEGATPGAVLAVVHDGELVRLRGFGRVDPAADSPEATPGTIYDVASLTKVVGTTTAAMILLEEGQVDLDDAVVSYLPWWGEGDPRKADVTLRHLLLHRAGLPPFRPFYRDITGRMAYEKALGGLALEYDPGSRTSYSDLGLMTLGFVVEAVSGEPLDVFTRERIWGPLGMRDTGYLPTADLLPRIAPTERDTIFRHTHVHGVVHDENAYALGGVAGHAGLFSTAFDLSVFAQTMLGGGVMRECVPGDPHAGLCTGIRSEALRLVGESTIDDFTRRHDETASRALGWDTPASAPSSGEAFSVSAFGHTGFTGTSLWIDPEIDLAVVLLTNRVNPTRENRRHVPLRRAVHREIVRVLAAPEGDTGGG